MNRTIDYEINPFRFMSPVEIVKRRDRRIRPYLNIMPYDICPFARTIDDVHSCLESVIPAIPPEIIQRELERELDERSKT